jgi:hypothetical protein
MFCNRTIKTKHVKNLQRGGNCVSWSYDGDAYMTNTHGEGIWRLSLNNENAYEWKQIEGTCQFSLRDMSMSGIRKKLNRKFDWDYEWVEC